MLSSSLRPVPRDRLPPLGASDAGLTESQVAMQRRHGFNDILARVDHGGWQVVRDTVRDPMIWFLLLTAALFFLLGQRKESLILLVATAPLAGMDAYLHRRTAASMGGLASRLASSARVLRDGVWRVVPSRELVPGDLAEVSPGDYFPADGLLVSGIDLQVDESTLTGESLPVPKLALPPAASLPELVPEVHWGTAGTRLLTGTAGLRVAAIGAETRYGAIVRSALGGRQVATPLQQAIGQLVGVLLGMALLLCMLLAGVRLWHGHGWVDALLRAVTLAVAALPEEFPVVYTFFLGVGVFRLARRNALVQRAVAVENIGRTTCIMSDKTGTITLGALALSERSPAEGQDDASVLRVATLASRSDSGDPLDVALHAAAGTLPHTVRLASFPFTEARRRETIVWEPAPGVHMAFTKGAPETVLAACSLPEGEQARWRARVEAHAASGRKVIACAHREIPATLPLDVEPDTGFHFAGLLAFEDPVRAGVREAIADCVEAGMRVVMVTGDHPATAAAVARKIGLGGNAPKVVVLDPGNDAGGVRAAVHGAHVVARATPDQKVAVVKALQAGGELVAVTGDGVNDVPALRLGDIGVAMGERGTRSAREVAPIVLLDDNFKTIVDAVAEGRQLFQNLRLAFTYLILVHMPLVVGSAVIPLLDLPLLFLPIHIVWLELVIHPTAMLAFQGLPALGRLAPVSRGRPARFFSIQGWRSIGLVGALLSLALVLSFLHALGPSHDAAHARALAMTLLVTASGAITWGLTGLRDPASRWLVLATLASAGVLVQVPGPSRLMGLSPLLVTDWAWVAAGFCCVVFMTHALAAQLRARPE